jgi:flagellar hook protein FlgE
MGYQQGLSGLSGASADLDVIGNNIANANTVGFKEGQAIFADMYANSVASAVNNQVGIGTQLAEVQQQFGQGTITTTNQALDIAINGNGFYQLSDNGADVYSRNGVFQLNASGQIVNAEGQELMGYAANSAGVINSASTVPLTIPTTSIAPSATKNVAFAFNLDSQSANIPSTTTFNPSDNTTYSASSSIQINDSLGGTSTLGVYFVKNSTGSWTAYATDGPNNTPVGTTPPTTPPTGALGTVTFDSSGNMTTNPATFNITVPDASGTGTQAITLNLGGTTQFGETSGVTTDSQDGFGAGQLASFSIGTDGTITGTYTNQQTQVLGQIALANFANQNGLLDIGNNAYEQTAASGAPEISTPGSTNHGTLQGGAVEDSNVDLTSSLVDLITAQRNYQANAQTIKTQQTVDQTLLNL